MNSKFFFVTLVAEITAKIKQIFDVISKFETREEKKILRMYISSAT